MFAKFINGVFLIALAAFIVLGLSRTLLRAPVDKFQSDTGQLNSNENAEKVSVDEATHTVSENKYFFSEPAGKPQAVAIKIFKNLRLLELYGDEQLIGRFKVGLGGSPSGHKQKEGDSKTPEGSYYICTINTTSQFTLFLGISYPGIEDAEKGLRDNRINQATFDKIENACLRKQQPPWNTPLGGEIGIHGGGNEYDWTLGCIALSNEDILLLGKYATINTPVEILP